MRHFADKESKFLGLMILNQDNIQIFNNCIKSFYEPVQNAYYQAFVKIKQNNQPLTFKHISEHTGFSMLEVDSEYKEFVKFVLPSDHKNVEQLIDEYLELRNEHELQELCENIQDEFDNGLTNQQIADKVNEIVNRRRVSLNVKGVSEAVYEAVEEITAPASEVIPTKFHGLDELVKIRKGNLIIISARPKVGKTTVAINIASNIARSKKVLFVSLEMRTQEIIQKFYNRAAKSSNGAEIDRAQALINQNLNLRLIDAPAMSIDDIRQLIRKEKPDVVFIDQLDCLVVNKKLERHDLRVGENVTKLKELASSTETAIVLLHQLNRGADKDEKPGLSHLKDTSIVEQKCDAALLLWSKNDGGYPRELFCSVAANRMGDTGMVNFIMFGNQSRIEEVERGKD